MAEKETTYWSLQDLADVAGKHIRAGAFPVTGYGLREQWHGVDSWDEARSLALDGWADEAAEAMDIAESAVETVESEHDLPAFRAVWDLSGSEVDIGRYFAGEPENMIDYEVVPTTRAGRVIVLCASVSVSSIVSVESIKRRGHTVAALAFALERIGYAVELWADFSAQGVGSRNRGHIARMRTLVKGANDELDPAKVMFAYAHPAMLRALSLAATHEYNATWQKRVNVGMGYGRPQDPKQDLPEGAIYLPCVLSDEDVPDADKALLGHLRDLGVVTD